MSNPLRSVALVFASIGVAWSADFPPAQLPAGGSWRTQDGAVIAAADLGKLQTIPINGSNVRRFKMAGIAPGAYRVGFVVGTGIHISNPTSHLPSYRIAIEGGAGEAIAKSIPPSLMLLPEPAQRPQRRPDEKDKEWAPWRGFAVSTQPVRLDGEAVVALSMGRDQFDIIPACWIEPLSAIPDAVAVSVHTDAVDRAFAAGNPPRFALQLVNTGMKAFAGKAQVDVFDMLTDRTSTELVDIGVPAGGLADLDYRPKLANGVFRLTVRPTTGAGNQPGFAAASLVVANGPALQPKDLPDDWPLGTHHYNPSSVLKGPMPGFKWYRTFIGWSQLNPKPGEYDWKNLDATIADLRAVGGKLLLCMEGAPLWTSKKEGRREGHVAPKDWNDLRTFAKELVARYKDSDVLGAIEPWNEPNANLRWHDTPESLVELHKIWFEETRGTKLKIAGISVSPGHHVQCVEDLTEGGILKFCDIVAAHFYEEPYSPNRYNLRNNLPLHIDLMRAPMWREGRVMPMWDTETGVGWEGMNGGPRPEGRMVTQDELVAALKQRKNYNAEQPWLMWAGNSERRMAANWVAGTVAMLAQGVTRRFSFHPNWYSFDGALNLPWVSNGTLGAVLKQVDYRYVLPLGINAVKGPADIGVVAYRIGKPGQKQVVVMWAERMTVFNPHPGGWTNWIEPVVAQLPCAEGITVQVQDLYLRSIAPVKAGSFPGGDAVEIRVGEEPVFVWDWQFRDQ